MATANFRYIVFIAVLVLIALLAGAAITFSDQILANFYYLIILGLFVFIIWKFDFIIQLFDFQRAVVYRFGKVNRVGGPGWAIVWPIIESYTMVDLRTKTIDIPKQDVVTKDGIELNVDAVIYLKVKKDHQSVVNSVIEIENYVEASRLYVTSSIRDVMGSMTLSEVISNIDVINAQIKTSLENISKNWGIAVESVEIKDVQIPETVLEAMHNEKAAVQQKLARMEKALAHKAEIEAVKDATSKLDNKALSYYYIKAIEGMSKSKGSKVFFPAEFSNLAGAFTGSKSEDKASPELEKYKDMLGEYLKKKSGKTEEKKKLKKSPKKQSTNKKTNKKSTNKKSSNKKTNKKPSNKKTKKKSKK